MLIAEKCQLIEAQVPRSLFFSFIDFTRNTKNRRRCTCWITSRRSPAASLINPENKTKQNWMLSARERNKQIYGLNWFFLSIFFLLLLKALIEEHCKVDADREANVKLHVIFASKFNYSARVFFFSRGFLPDTAEATTSCWLKTVECEFLKRRSKRRSTDNQYFVRKRLIAFRQLLTGGSKHGLVIGRQC